MLVKVLRRFTLEEVERELENLERTQNMHFEQFEEQVLRDPKKLEESWDMYLKWTNLYHAYRGYLESGELYCIMEEQREFSLEELRNLTPRRIQLLYQLYNTQIESINDLSRKVHRDVKNVHGDLKALKKLGFVVLERKRNGKVVPEAVVKEITFVVS